MNKGDQMKYRIEKPWLYLISDRDWTVNQFFDVYQIGQSKRKKRLLEKKLLVNKKSCNLNDSISMGCEIALCCFEDKVIDYAFDQQDCKIVYEDEFVLIVSKPSQMIIHSENKEEKGTLNSVIANYYCKQGIATTVRPIHRLDKDTTGCVLYSKVEFFQPFLDEQLSKNTIHRTYIAICKGLIPWKKKTVKLAIGKDRHHNQRQRVAISGKEAITHIEVLQQGEKRKITMVKCCLETGRTHQIRVHMQAIGYPLLGDSLYGQSSRFIQRCALHAWKISWIHPITGNILNVEDPTPDEILDCLFSEKVA